MADTWVFRDGARLTPWMAYRIDQLNVDFKKAFGYRVIVSSGVRTEAEQKAIFLARYVRYADVRGRRVYDTRWWNGVLWYRVSAAGTVAAPNSPQANHQIQGTKGAVDIRDNGPDAGIMTASSKRGRWIRQNASKYDLVADGDGFGEGWHFAMLGVLRTPPGSGSSGGSTPIPPKEKPVSVRSYHREDKTARTKGRTVKKGQAFYLNTTLDAPSSQATNIVGGNGDYAFAAHVYASGRPGDAVDVTLFWDEVATSGPHGAHYTERVVFGPSGLIRANFPFQRAVAQGFAVYARLLAPDTNTGDVTVTVFDTDAMLHP